MLHFIILSSFGCEPWIILKGAVDSKHIVLIILQEYCCSSVIVNFIAQIRGQLIVTF